MLFHSFQESNFRSEKYESNLAVILQINFISVAFNKKVEPFAQHGAACRF